MSRDTLLLIDFRIFCGSFSWETFVNQVAFYVEKRA